MQRRTALHSLLGTSVGWLLGDRTWQQTSIGKRLDRGTAAQSATTPADARATIVAEDFRRGYGAAAVTMPAGGSATGSLIGLHTFSGEFNVKDFGAIGDGVTDDADALARAYAAIPASGGVIVFPPAIYALGKTLALTKDNVTFRSGGFGAATLAFRGSGFLFDLEGAVKIDRVSFRDLIISISGRSTGGIRIGRTSTAFNLGGGTNLLRDNWVFHNLQIHGAVGNADARTQGRIGISVTELDQAQWSNIWVHSLETCMIVDRCTVCTYHRMRMQSFKYGLTIPVGDSPGGDLSAFYFLDILGPTTGDGGWGLKVDRASNKYYDVFLEGQDGASNGVLLWVTANGASSTFVNLAYSNNNKPSVLSTLKIDAGSADLTFLFPIISQPSKAFSIGRVLAPASKIKIFGGTKGWTTLMAAATTTDNYESLSSGSTAGEYQLDASIFRVMRDLYINGGLFPIGDVTTSAAVTVGTHLQMGAQIMQKVGAFVLGVGAVQISVAGANVVTVKGAAGANNVTALIDGAEGQTVTLIAMNNLFTLAHGGTLRLNGNWVAAADKTITLIRTGGSWYEQSRSAP